MSKHTPGPWKDCVKELVTLMQGKSDEARANIRLAAAAPNLLAVLRVTTHMLAFEAQCLEERGERDKAVPVRGQVALARAAIKTATDD